MEIIRLTVTFAFFLELTVFCRAQEYILGDAEHENQQPQENGGRNLKVIQSAIPNRIQWDCNYRSTSCCQDNQSCNAICDGYCGSVSIQESLLYYGAYVSQGIIRRTVWMNDKDSAIDVLIDAGPPDMLKTAELLGLKGVTKYNVEVNQFVQWTKTQLEDFDAPVAIGVNIQGKKGSYDHIVTAIGGVQNGLRFNDHYASNGNSKTATIDDVPKNGESCKNQYCLAQKMWGLALRKPPAVPKKNLVRLKVVGENPFREPNWTCLNRDPVVKTLEATAAYPNLLDFTSGSSWYVAVTFRATTAQQIRSKGGGNLHSEVWSSECYPLQSPNDSVFISVPSDSAVFTKIVNEQDCGGAPAPAPAPVPAPTDGGGGGCATVKVKFEADKWPGDNYFFLENLETGKYVWDRSSFDKWEVVVISTCIKRSGCFLFDFYDEEGDGLIKPGKLTLWYDGERIFRGRKFGHGIVKYLGDGCGAYT